MPVETVYVLSLTRNEEVDDETAAENYSGCPDAGGRHLLALDRQQRLFALCDGAALLS